MHLAVVTRLSQTYRLKALLMMTYFAIQQHCMMQIWVQLPAVAVYTSQTYSSMFDCNKQ